MKTSCWSRMSPGADPWPPILPISLAAQYCGYKTTSAIRHAVRRGRLQVYGRRGGSGAQTFLRSELDRYLQGCTVCADDPVTPQPEDVTNERAMDLPMEKLDSRDGKARSVAQKGGWLPGPVEGEHPTGPARDTTRVARGQRDRGGRRGAGPSRRCCGPSSGCRTRD
jgi:hypothetical protein